MSLDKFRNIPNARPMLGQFAPLAGLMIFNYHSYVINCRRRNIYDMWIISPSDQKLK